MNQELIDLAVERGRLIERISLQRQLLEQQLQPVGNALHTVDRAIGTVREGTAYVREHPELVTLGVAVLVLIKPSRAWRWGKRAYLSWRTWQVLRRRFPVLGELFGVPGRV